MNIDLLIEELFKKDTTASYKCLLELEEISDRENTVYTYFDTFLEMLDNEKSFIRVRGFRLICKNAKWDKDNKINQNINKILTELDDEKPTAVRQCLASLKYLIENKQELKNNIKEKLLGINYLKYNDSMQGLIFKDAEENLFLLK
ncbi:MAG: SufBD protein [Clostridia bacterium]|nr:SufBD protein [Clostridia bacterium]